MAATNINRVVLTGNLTRDPELRSTASGMSVCSLRVACNTRRKNNSTGDWEDKPNYFDVTVWGAQGENCARFLAKGRPVAIDGRLEWREWEERETGNKRQAIDIIADSVQFLGGRDDAQGGGGVHAALRRAGQRVRLPARAGRRHGEQRRRRGGRRHPVLSAKPGPAPPRGAPEPSIVPDNGSSMRAHVFDMDGTLLHGTTAPVLLAAALGEPEALAALETRFSSGAATTVQFARALHDMWGVVAPEVAQQAFAAAPVVANVREVLARHPPPRRALLPDHDVAGLLRRAVPRLRLRRRVRVALPALCDDAAGRVRHPQPGGQATARRPVLRRAWAPLDDAIAYGDSMSDVFLFEQVGVRVSVNGDHHLAERSDIAVEGTDLLLAYRAARELCDGGC